MKATLVLVVITSLMTVLHAVDVSKPFDLTTTLGEKFKECHISKVTPAGLTIVHRGGVARVGFDVLDKEWRTQFNYDPAKAHAYAQAEEEKRQAAEAKRAEMERQRRLVEDEQLNALAAAERKRIDAESRAVKEYQDSVKAANTPPAPLAPLPGDATPSLSTVIPQPQPIMQTEAVVPTLSPVGDPYSPTRIRSRTYILQDGYYDGGYYGGYPYGYGGYQPVYGGYSSGYCQPYQPVYGGYPNCAHPYTTCPTSSFIPGVHGTISTGGFSLHINH